MNLLLFVITIGISFIVVRIGAIAFELTGIEWSVAKFQALSCFTGTGFTTREAEMVVVNPQRRKIATVLMVFGNAGLVTLIATFANSIRTPDYISKIKMPLLHFVVPSFLIPWANLFVIIGAFYVSYRLFSSSGIAQHITVMLRRKVIKHAMVKPVSFEELVVATGGYGVSSIDICDNSPILNKTLREAELKKHDILLLAIERNKEIIPNPSSDERLIRGDRLICFGKLDIIRREICLL